MALTRWTRGLLWATAAMNVLGAVVFIPGFPLVREAMGLPSAGHPIYLWVIAAFIFIFGVAYAYCALTAYAPRVFIAVAAAGKLAFFATLLGFWSSGDLPLRAAVGASADLFFGCVFLVWLARARGATAGI